MSIVKKTILSIPNPTQDSHIPSFVPETTKGQKIRGDELVRSLPALPSPLAPVNDDHKVESPYSPHSLYMDLGVKPCVQKSSKAALVNMWKKIQMLQKQK